MKLFVVAISSQIESARMYNKWYVESYGGGKFESVSDLFMLFKYHFESVEGLDAYCKTLEENVALETETLDLKYHKVL